MYVYHGISICKEPQSVGKFAAFPGFRVCLMQPEPQWCELQSSEFCWFLKNSQGRLSTFQIGLKCLNLSVMSGMGCAAETIATTTLEFMQAPQENQGSQCLSLDGSCAGPVALLSQSAREGLDDLSKKTRDFSHFFCHTCDAPSCHISACVTLACQVLARDKQTWSSLGIANCGSLNLDQKTFTRTRELVSNKYRFRVLPQTQCWRIHENSLKSQCLFARRPPWPYSSTQGVLAPEAEFVCCLLQVSLFARHCKTWHCTSFAFLLAHVRTPHSSDPPQCLPFYSPLFASFVTAETWHNAAGMEQDWDVSRWEVSCLSLSWAKHSHTLESQRLRLCSSGRRTEELSGLPSLACHQRRCAMLCHVLQKLHRTRLVEGRSLGQVFAVRQPPQSQVSTQAGSSMYEEIYKRCI